jgi:hypothetical protein
MRPDDTNQHARSLTRQTRHDPADGHARMAHGEPDHAMPGHGGGMAEHEEMIRRHRVQTLWMDFANIALGL